ncbi:hypothetical protein OHA70_02275 [Kribbella sp. NBC_00382]|uniref:hypothetical protein n=1 Tax=Kribbella sp. NBC_00382 TaxID=2975967 RepID=UPI002E1C5195
MSCHAEAAIDLPLDPQAAWDALMDWNGRTAWPLIRPAFELMMRISLKRLAAVVAR